MGRSSKSVRTSSTASGIYTSLVSLTGTLSSILREKFLSTTVDRNFSLIIIDFDVAMQVESEGEVVGGHCGTEG